MRQWSTGELQERRQSEVASTVQWGLRLDQPSFSACLVDSFEKPRRPLANTVFVSHSENTSFLPSITVNMEGDSYIERKIDFVTGHTGSNLWDINQVTLVAPVRYIFDICLKPIGTTLFLKSNW